MFQLGQNQQREFFNDMDSKYGHADLSQIENPQDMTHGQLEDALKKNHNAEIARKRDIIDNSGASSAFKDSLEKSYFDGPQSNGMAAANSNLQDYVNKLSQYNNNKLLDPNTNNTQQTALGNNQQGAPVQDNRTQFEKNRDDFAMQRYEKNKAIWEKANGGRAYPVAPPKWINQAHYQQGSAQPTQLGNQNTGNQNTGNPHVAQAVHNWKNTGNKNQFFTEQQMAQANKNMNNSLNNSGTNTLEYAP